jgi:hypothetical protein
MQYQLAEPPTNKQARHAFTSLVNKLVAFRKQGQLTEDQFTAIVSYASSVYLEFCLESRLQETLGKGLLRSIHQ